MHRQCNVRCRCNAHCQRWRGNAVKDSRALRVPHAHTRMDWATPHSSADHKPHSVHPVHHGHVSCDLTPIHHAPVRCTPSSRTPSSRSAPSCQHCLAPSSLSRLQNQRWCWVQVRQMAAVMQAQEFMTVRCLSSSLCVLCTQPLQNRGAGLVQWSPMTWPIARAFDAHQPLLALDRETWLRSPCCTQHRR